MTLLLVFTFGMILVSKINFIGFNWLVVVVIMVFLYSNIFPNIKSLGVISPEVPLLYLIIYIYIYIY